MAINPTLVAGGSAKLNTPLRPPAFARGTKAWRRHLFALFAGQLILGQVDVRACPHSMRIGVPAGLRRCQAKPPDHPWSESRMDQSLSFWMMLAINLDLLGAGVTVE